MAAPSENLIDFDVIEAQKENIQSLPGGRSAKKLADLFSPSPLQKLATPTPNDTKTINDCIRAEYEAEVASLAESDDPLDVFDRYVRWTLDAYPSAQATPSSQLHTLLERATRTFVHNAQYKNDPRYLKLWLLYIQFFAESPREAFVFLSRHGIAEGLALFYEEYAVWLEGAGRWNQAEEVYKLGIEREARPTQRLLRKFKEFEERMAAQDDLPDTPGSPALPTVRPALAAKADPFAAAARALDPQAPRPTNGVGGQASKPGKSKLQIFSDADASAAAPALGSREAGSKGWDTIDSLADRKKENVMEAKPWAGETLKAGGKKSSAPKMAVFRDPKQSQVTRSHIVLPPSMHQIIVNPANGKRERIFVDLEACYPTPEEPGSELSFEEIWAAGRGWLHQTWEDDTVEVVQTEFVDENAPIFEDLVPHPVERSYAPAHTETVMLDENGNMIKTKGRKMKTVEVNETQIIEAKLDSPSGPKIKKRSAEPTMTLHTKAATDEIYELFNAPLKSAAAEEEESADEEDYETDGGYTSGAESTGTTRQIATSEAGDDDDDETSDVKSVSEWSDFTARKHIPKMDGDGGVDVEEPSDTRDVSDLIDIREPESDPSRPVSREADSQAEDEREGLATPVDDDFSPQVETRTTFVPIPPEDYEPRTQPFRTSAERANNRLPFMTPITERTETSLGMTGRKEQCKTPSRRVFSGSPSFDEEEEEEEEEEPEENDEATSEVLSDEVMSSPLIDVDSDPRAPAVAATVSPPPKFALPLLQKTKVPPPKGPIIHDQQCNPVDESVRLEILAKMQPPLSAYDGFYDHQDEECERGGEIRKYAKAVVKQRASGADKTGSISMPVVIQFPDVTAQYTLKRELGAGAFAPVYLVENSSPNDAEGEDEDIVMGKGAFAIRRRTGLEALKMEAPPSAWEFHMMRLAHMRLGSHHRAAASLSQALEMHLYRDEGFLFLPYHPHGTLLDVVNFFRAEPSAVMDELLAMFFTIELLRTVEALHARGIMHGDLKPDNTLLRLDVVSSTASSSPSLPAGSDSPQQPSQQLASQYRADGSGGWSSRGVTLIDFGRGIDMRAFRPDVAFIADWRTTAQDCAEMREGRPWTWQIDYHGLAGIVHCLLFGRYIETVRCDAGGLGTASGRRYKVRESLKRYWQTDLWASCFDLLLNPGQHVEIEDGARMPVLKGLKTVREGMEKWLEANCERGVGLRGLLLKVEAFAKGKK